MSFFDGSPYVRHLSKQFQRVRDTLKVDSVRQLIPEVGQDDEQLVIVMKAHFMNNVWTGECGLDNRTAIEGLFEGRPFGTCLKARNLHQAIVTDYHTFSPDTAMEINRIIGANGLIPHAGEYRTIHVHASFCSVKYVPPIAIEPLMNELFRWSNHTKTLCHNPESILALGTVFLSEFLLIHPFYNGNGRTARILTSLLLSNYFKIPLTPGGCEKTPFEERMRYLDTLNARNQRFHPPVELGHYLVESVERSLSDWAWLQR